MNDRNQKQIKLTGYEKNTSPYWWVAVEATVQAPTVRGGIQSLKEVLENNSHLDFSNSALTSVTSIYADGLVIVGKGINPDGNDEVWRISLENTA